MTAAPNIHIREPSPRHTHSTQEGCPTKRTVSNAAPIGGSGLTPSEDSSGQRRRLGAITKTGNGHARRLLVEAAWHQRRPLRPSVALEKRRGNQPARVRAQADRSARRLNQRWQALESRGKKRTIVAVAVARELAAH